MYTQFTQYHFLYQCYKVWILTAILLRAPKGGTGLKDGPNDIVKFWIKVDVLQ